MISCEVCHKLIHKDSTLSSTYRHISILHLSLWTFLVKSWKDPTQIMALTWLGWRGLYTLKIPVTLSTVLCPLSACPLSPLYKIRITSAPPWPLSCSSSPPPPPVHVWYHTYYWYSCLSSRPLFNYVHFFRYLHAPQPVVWLKPITVIHECACPWP